MTARQLVLDLPARQAFDRDDFLVAPCNADAVAWLDRWPDWPGQMLVVYGPTGSGKSHLSQVWRHVSQAQVLPPDADLMGDVRMLSASGNSVLIDDAPAALATPDGARILLHAINLAREGGGTVLLAAETPPAQWTIDLPDLASRLAAAPVVGISAPDDTLLQALMVKQFHDRQVLVRNDVVTYLLSRMERSFAAARSLTEALDAAALAAKQPITIPLARRILDQLSSARDNTC